MQAAREATAGCAVASASAPITAAAGAWARCIIAGAADGGAPSADKGRHGGGGGRFGLAARAAAACGCPLLASVPEPGRLRAAGRRRCALPLGGGDGAAAAGVAARWMWWCALRWCSWISILKRPIYY